MNNLTKKQKIIVIVIISFIILGVGICGYSMILQYESDEQEIETENMELQGEIAKDKQIEQEKLQSKIKGQGEKESTNIVIHITGAVKKTGIITLPEGARIADAIKASRRYYKKCRFK